MDAQPRSQFRRAPSARPEIPPRSTPLPQLVAQSGHSRHRNNLSAFGQQRTNSGALLARVIGSCLCISFQFGRASAPSCHAARTAASGRMRVPAGRRHNRSRRGHESDRSRDRDTTRQACARRWRACCRGSWEMRLRRSRRSLSWLWLLILPKFDYPFRRASSSRCSSFADSSSA
jgi:hypothetical protein